MGKVIAFEGIDGSGKTTVIDRIVERLRSDNKSVLVLREPGSTPLGNQIRTILKSPTPRSQMAEVFLFMASRAELYHHLTSEGVLDTYDYILLDRFIDSTIAYQGYGNGIDIELLKQLNSISAPAMVPSHNIFIHISLEESKKRLSQLVFDGDRFEFDNDFAKSVYDGYQELIRQKPYFVVENNDLEEATELIIQYITKDSTNG